MSPYFISKSKFKFDSFYADFVWKIPYEPNFISYFANFENALN